MVTDLPGATATPSIPSTTDQPLELSVVIPVYNEEPNVQPLYLRLAPVLSRLGKRSEIIFIDDGSTDGTLGRLMKLTRKDPTVKVLQLRRNFGQTAALSAGFAHAAGKIIITMDGDLQNDPNDIPALIAELEKGADIVNGWRSKRADPAFSKRIPSKISNRFARILTGVNLNDFGCGLKAYRHEAIDDLVLYGEMHRYIPAICAWNGFTVGEMKVEHHPRIHGKTKYGWRRLIRGFWDLMNIKFWSAYSTRPLHLFGMLGALIFFAGVIIALYLTVLRLVYDVPLTDRPLLMLSILMIIFGMQIFMFGFLAEMNTRMYYSDHRNKTYRIRNKIGRFHR